MATITYVPELSIIMPVHNGEDTIERAVQSVSDQTIDLRRLELIIVDDGSSDGTPDIIKRLTKRYPFCTSTRIEKSVRGAGRARNLGISIAAGSLLMFLDADDEYEPDACAALSDAIETFVCDSVSSVYSVVTTERSAVPPIFSHPVFVNNRPSIASDVPQYFWCAPAVPTRICKKSLFFDESIKMREGVVAEDVAFAFQILFGSKCVAHINSITYKHYRFRREDRSTCSNTIDTQFFDDLNTAFRDARTLCEENLHIEYAHVISGLHAEYAVRKLLETAYAGRIADQSELVAVRRILKTASPIDISVLSATLRLFADLIADGRYDDTLSLLRLLKDHYAIHAVQCKDSPG